MKSKAKHHRSVVLLTAYNAQDSVVLETEISYDDYYTGSPPIIDKSAFREQRAIRKIVGRIYNSAGELAQQFTSLYGETGDYVGGRTIHQDGTVIED